MNVLRRIVQILIVACLYYLTARLGFLMALPPGNVTALWPPSGLALAAILIWGGYAGLGVFLGSFIVNNGSLSGPNAIAVSIAIASGSTLQAWLGAYLLRRFIRPIPPNTSLKVLQATAVVAVTTLVAMSVGVGSLYLGGFSTLQAIPSLAWTWWLGDFVGISVFTTLIVTLNLNLRKQKARQPFLWMLTGIMVGVTLFSFFVIQYSEKNNLDRQLETDTTEIQNALKSSMDREIQSLYAIRSASEIPIIFTRPDFLKFTKPFLEQTQTAINAISWVSFIEAGQLPSFTESMQSQFPGFSTFEKDSNGENIPLGKRTGYFIVSFIEPYESNSVAIGFDIGSNSSRLEAIIRARDTGEASATAPIHLIQETSEQLGILVMVPVYKSGVPLETVEDRQDNIIGLANGVYKIQDLVDKTLKHIHRHDLELYLFDLDTSGEPQLLATFETNPADKTKTVSHLEAGEFYSIRFDQFGRQWLLIAKPGSEYANNFSSWASWIILLGGIVLVSIFLYVTNAQQHTEILQETVFSISEAAHNTNSLTGLYAHIHQEIEKVMYAKNFFIALYSEEAHKLHFVYFIDEMDEWTTEPFDPSNGLTGYVLRTGKSLLCDEKKDAELIASGDYQPVGAPSKIWMGVPLITQNQTIGVMAVQHYTDKQAYTERELRMMEFVSAQVATAITRKRAEDQIYKSEKLNSALIANAPDGIVIMDTDGAFTFGSPSTSRIFGYTTEDALGKTAIEWVHPDDQILIRGKFLELVKDPSKVFSAEYRFLHKNGTYRWLEGTFSNLETETGMKLIVCNFSDITERKKFINLLQQSQANLEAAQATAHLGSWDMNPITGKGYWSKEMFHLFDRDPSQGTPLLPEFMEMILPADRDRLMNAQEQAILHDTPVIIEYCTNHPEKERRYFQATIAAVKDPNGNLVKMSGTVLDITELKRVHRQLESMNRDLEQRVEERTSEVRRSEATYRALFENSNDGIFLIEPTGRGISANQRALEMVGYTLEEYRNMELERNNPFTKSTEQREDGNKKFKAVLKGEYVPLYERTFTAKDGSAVEVEINLSPIRDTQGKIILVQSVVREITERKRAETALRESTDKLRLANIELEKASRLKDEFLASMSHELRTPLAGILGLAESLELNTYGELNEKQLRTIQTIRKSGLHLLELINDILDLSKIVSGKLEVDILPCDVHKICLSSLQLAKGIANQRNQQVSFNISPESIITKADERRLKQMLVNLLSNAVKFTPEGGQIGLDVTGDRDNKVIRFRVWDKGIGIKDEDIEKLFKPFIQLDSRLAREYPGTGLGLSLVLKMAELHGGKVQVESKFGEGSSFTITLPWEQSNI